MALNKDENKWLDKVMVEFHKDMKEYDNKMKIKRMRKVKRLPSNYYHNYYTPSAKEMYEEMLASVDEE